MLDPIKQRFVRANSALAFPRLLGSELASGPVPRLHSFAWNLGLRAEPETPSFDIAEAIAWDDLHPLVDTYFRLVHPIFDILDQASFDQEVALRWNAGPQVADIDAVILGVAVLGSFFSIAGGHPREAEWGQQAKTLLESKITSPSATNIAAWILRSLYLRSITRPQVSWLSSARTMHLVESTGLHKDIQTIYIIIPAAPAISDPQQNLRRRLFWIARSLNTLFSYEYGRQRVNFEIITTSRPSHEPQHFSHQIIELAETLPSDVINPPDNPDPPSALLAAVKEINNMSTTSEFISLLKADVAFSIYRRLRIMGLTEAKESQADVIEVGSAAMKSAQSMLTASIPWWNVMTMPFQFVCVLLAVDTPDSLSRVADVVNFLSQIVQTYNTHMAREAYNTALLLVQLSQRRKETELGVLRGITDSAAPVEDYPVPAEDSPYLPEAGWFENLPIDWESFLNPHLVI
ncbi:hypothetical protein MMC28_004875 [Mycoblastus sanguinarius]|nr:hypothetical protein [Mycoblastus sanguinarius]